MSATATGGGKICVICKQDCSTRPRVKDPQGRYMCRECHRQAQQQIAATVPTEAALPAHGLGGQVDDADMFSDLPAVSVETQPCASCGMPLSPAVVVCSSCGFNRQTGKAPKIKVSKEGPSVSEAAGAAARALILANPLVWVLAGAVAAIAGTGVWYLIAMQTGSEIKFVTIGVGVPIGLAIKLVAGDRAGGLSGGMAVALTIAAVFGGKYLVFHGIVTEIERDLGLDQGITMTEEGLLVAYAREVAIDRESRGEELGWPYGMTAEAAVERADFPSQLWNEAARKWAGADPAWKASYKAEKEAELRAEWQAAKSDGFFEAAFLDFKGLGFMAVSLMAALWVGSGGALSAALSGGRAGN